MLPKQVCTNCCELLNQCLAFKYQVASVDTALRRCIDQHKKVEIGIKEEVFESFYPGITQQHIFDATFPAKELNEGHKVEELIEDEDDIAGDEMAWEKDVKLYSKEDNMHAAVDDCTIVYSSESQRERLASPIGVISSPSKVQQRRTSVKCEQCEKTFSGNSHLRKHIKSHATDKLKNQCLVHSKSCSQEIDLKDKSSHKIPNESAEQQTDAFKCAKCKASFAAERDLYIHGSIHLEGEIKCRECGKNFSSVLNGMNGKVEEDDILPKQLCSNCYEMLNQCLAFKEQVASADTALRRYVDQRKQIEIGTKIFEASDCGMAQQHIFNALPAVGESNQGYKMEELIEDEDYASGDEIVWEKDAKVYLEEDKKLAESDPPEDKNVRIMSPIDVILSPSKVQHKTQIAVKYEQYDKAFSCDSPQEKHIRSYVSEKLKNRCQVRSKSFCQETGLKEDLASPKVPNEDAREHINAFKCSDGYIHGSMHPGDNKTEYRQCSRDFSKLPNLQSNRSTHYKDELPCLNKHIYKHTNLGKLIHPVCQKSFADRRELMNHISLVVGNKPFVCKFCDKSFKFKCSLLIHQRVHTGKKPYKRSYCPKSFRLQSTLADNVRTLKAEKQYKCSHCFKSFDSSSVLAIHVRTHSNEKPYKCRLCSKSFSSRTALTVHVRTHTGEKPFKCLQCSKMFGTSSSLTYHIRTHTGERPYKCSYCPKSFIRSAGLSVHVRKHTGEKPHKCPHCSKATATAPDLTKHIRTHTGEKPFKCSQCSKSFARASSLTIHERTHTGEKPYKCPHCSKSFRNTSGLIVHVRTHTGEKPYKCSQCLKSFGNSSRLNIHIRTHTGEKPYKCSHCSKSFSRSSSLADHVHTHTGEKPYKCPHCPKALITASGLARHIKTHIDEKSNNGSEASSFLGIV